MKEFELTEENDPRCAEYYAKAFPNLTKEKQENLRLNWIKDIGKEMNISDVSDNRSKLFKTLDFVEWLEKVSPEWINIKDLEMYVSNYSQH